MSSYLTKRRVLLTVLSLFISTSSLTLIHSISIKKNNIKSLQEPNKSTNCSLFIIGYGSLFSNSTRSDYINHTDYKTYNTDFFYVTLHKYIRGFFYQTDHSKIFPWYAALGLKTRGDDEQTPDMNAVMFCMSDNSNETTQNEILEGLDEREAKYKRSLVAWNDIILDKEVYDGDSQDDARLRFDDYKKKASAKVFVYTISSCMEKFEPNRDFPLSQTYIDLSMKDLSKNKKIADAFVKSTKGWDNKWYYNDRIGNTVVNLTDSEIEAIDKAILDNADVRVDKLRKRSFWFKNIRKPGERYGHGYIEKVFKDPQILNCPILLNKEKLE